MIVRGDPDARLLVSWNRRMCVAGESAFATATGRDNVTRRTLARSRTPSRMKFTYCAVTVRCCSVERIPFNLTVGNHVPSEYTCGTENDPDPVFDLKPVKGGVSSPKSTTQDSAFW
jgi:hypothetical protein